MDSTRRCVCAFRDNVTAHLESGQTSDSERQRILSILQRFQQDDASDHAAHQSSNADSEQDSDNELAISEALLQKLSLSVSFHLKQQCSLQLKPAVYGHPLLRVYL